MNRSEQAAVQCADAERTVCELCSSLTSKRWINASCGNISIRDGNTLFVAPVGLRSEARCPYPIFFLDINGRIQEIEEAGAPLIEGKSLILLLISLGAGAVIHSHSVNALIAANLHQNEFVFEPYDVRGLLRRSTPLALRRIPIIDNAPLERDMELYVRRALDKDPAPRALLIRGHGLYVWGADWWEAKTYAEHLDYLFQVVINLKQAAR